MKPTRPRPETGFAAEASAALAKRDLRATLAPLVALDRVMRREFGGIAPINVHYLDRLERAAKALRPTDCLDPDALARYLTKAMGGAVVSAVAQKVKHVSKC